ncbi:Acetylcholinesterase [Holothuria leucospilota]|uniref:Carboxylic ester hydrolase n=1 Tax=Holothuria leucospilota TaxID=206669 RepID=A0A9Q1BRS7_HOLLE|nr:Acetylcholinesterase [Holothuria leucospilota]
MEPSLLFCTVLVAMVTKNLVNGQYSQPIVKTTKGTFLGIDVPFSTGFLTKSQNVHAFLGIPFAKPPTGERRFKMPEPVDSSDGSYNATQMPPQCSQGETPFLRPILTATDMSEDCLYLNVFVPSNSPRNAAVMVWIHGGGFAFGYGLNIPTNHVALAAIGDVIVVTFNYRLGILGLLSTGDDNISPNLALFDQREALKWVYENIEAFGGDPNRVTIFGESSGGASVGWHILSSESRQYFQRAILQTGNPLDPWANLLTRSEAFERAQMTAALAGCDSTNNGSAILYCLGEKTVEELIAIPSLGRWSPVNDGIFFKSSVPELLQKGAYQGIDVIIGTNRDDAFFLVYLASGFPKATPNITKTQFSSLLSGSSDSFIADLLEVIYSEDIQNTESYVFGLIRGLTDSAYVCGMSNFARQVSTAGSRVYMYVLTHAPAQSLWNVSWSRAGHIEESQFVFGLPFQALPQFSHPYDEIKISAYVMQFWTNFAKTGDPNTSEDSRELPVPEWIPFTAESEDYKEIDIGFSNKQKLRSHQCNFWENLLLEIRRLLGNVVYGLVPFHEYNYLNSCH